ncbi:zeta toxin family protein [Helicobacter cetorum]|uniref:zeta toxin family protein n=1 Tax=Helicobacter cetorum TaxID=138563 RepID=UPI000CF1619E|nr:zeta toxin family protein [Helicobacter cetorum]
MMSSEDFIKSIHNFLNKTIDLTDEKIKEEALEYVKNNKQGIIDFFIKHKSMNQIAYFMAGGPGAGKSEASLSLLTEHKIDIIEADAIRKILPHYNGKNASLFQKASSKGVEYLFTEALKNHYGFIMDGNFAHLEIQKSNVSRTLKKGYEVKILYIYRHLETAKEYTRIREDKEGRRVEEDTFYAKFLQSLEVANKIKEFYPIVSLNFYNVSENKSFENIESLDKIIDDNPKIQKDIQTAKNFLENKLSKELSHNNMPLNNHSNRYAHNTPNNRYQKNDKNNGGMEM